jgi:hypothetical protein
LKSATLTGLLKELPLSPSSDNRSIRLVPYRRLCGSSSEQLQTFARRTALLILSIGLMLSDPIALSAAQIDQLSRVAVALLRTSIACPNPLENWIGKSQSGSIWQLNELAIGRYLGTESRFREYFSIESIVPDSPGTRIEKSTRIIDFKYADLSAARQQGEWVIFSCKQGLRCIHSVIRKGTDAVQQQELDSFKLPSCDQAAAEDIKRAVDALMTDHKSPEIPVEGIRI